LTESQFTPAGSAICGFRLTKNETISVKEKTSSANPKESFESPDRLKGKDDFVMNIEELTKQKEKVK
jgi:hypothetical protein